ncbi:phage tail tape measure protein, partial [bacterium]|nr:phage tail tape measure protein [bacterium]
MAQENLVTNIVAKSDFSDLISDLGKVSSRLNTLQTQLNNTNRILAAQGAQIQKSFGGTLRSTGQFSTQFVSLTSDVEKFGKNLDAGRLKLSQYYQTWQQHAKTSTGLVRQLAQQQVQLQNAILQPLGKNAQGLMQYNVHIPAGLDKVKHSSALARQELQIMNKVIQQGANQLINWGKNTQWAGRQLTVGLTLPISAFGKAAADAFRLADQELVRLTKVYGGIAATSASDLKKIREDVSATARELSQTYGASYRDTIALAADIAATGKQGNDLLKSTQETTRLSILGEVDRQEAMKATLAIQTAFKQNTEQLAESINFLNAVENQTSTSLSDLVEAIPKAGPVVQSLGGSVQDLALYLTAMREGGINASEGANALKSALASLINPTKVAKAMFADFGIDLEGIVTKNAGNLTGTILELQRALDTLNPLQKQQAIEQLFGKFQFSRLNALFANLGKQGSQTLQVLDLMKASSADLANIAGRELSQITESASGRYRRALETLRADLAQTGESFLNIGTKAINIIDKAINFFNKLPDPIKHIIGFVGGLT